MLLTLIVLQLSVLVAGNPFHKYPFVFLLDVGNEELENADSKQIRLSIPGGSVALRYPAIGDGNTIGHIRVSGIDFGTDLKANIVDGGPGYRYVVLVFMGNPGVAYDAVVTVQTVIDSAFNIPNIGTVATSTSDDVGVQEDINNSAEDLSDDTQTNDNKSGNYMQTSNAELMQSSHNVYSYVQNDMIDESDDSDENDSPDDTNDESNDEFGDEQRDDEELDSNVEETENESDQKDIHKEYTDSIDQIDDDSNVKVNDIDTEDGDKDEEAIYEENEEPTRILSSNSKYDNYRSYSGGEEVYNEYNEQNNVSPEDYQQKPLDYDDDDELSPFFNDGEVHNSDKYRDSNNNNIDSDDNYAVAY